jgi:hypothetical protein
LTYDLAVTVELTYKVVRPSKKGYFIPLKAYHITCNLISLAIAVVQVTVNDAYWDEKTGCDLSKSRVSM